jgi:4-hydroxy-4-methyl-2-oxoglutarate aldolase
MRLWNNDDELFDLAKSELFSALVGDVLDKMGFLYQFLPQQIKPVLETMVVVGRAFPVLEADVYAEKLEGTANPIMAQPFGLMFNALDSLKPNEVYICSGASYHYALWGGLMSTRAIKLGAAGAVVNGYSRDTNEIIKLNFPTFSAGSYAQDQGPRGKVIDYRLPIEFGGIRINPGDIVFGDRDGVIVVPEQVEVEVFSKAIEKARGEKLVKMALEEGMSTVDAFKKFGIM